ncbi:hypothetical protein MKX07_001217 [Trichoderma sp. CBMAI-0711]|uniref:SnoaL-like domain-containing protein n=1 Tax=Trichoderma parareesei TaxID=858221 RepID=A0A2H2Z4V6_TRIPA|nr:hypothetical protein MKX07_001217 [Trichoderma sp. CBMAI-0711]OTA03207.1 hypothetical protein A9Z42_0036460 [Trichoderma parareesei]
MAGSVNEAGYTPLYAAADSRLPDEAGIRAFLSEFYRISDRPEENERWVEQFTADARVAIGSGKATGTEELRTMREGMWSVVAKRKHTVVKVFPGRFEDGDDGRAAEGDGRCELMLYGDVAYTTKDGDSSTVAWAGHGILRKVRVHGEGEGEGEEEEAWKFAEYRVYMLK